MLNRISSKFLIVTVLISVTGYLLYRYRIIKNEQTFDRLLRLSSFSVLDWDSIVDRDKEHKHLMKKLKINSYSGINPDKANTIEFIYFYNSDILMGYEYVFERTKENPNRVFIEEEEDLYDVCRKRQKNDGAYFKKINNNWNLYIVRLH